MADSGSALACSCCNSNSPPIHPSPHIPHRRGPAAPLGLSVFGWHGRSRFVQPFFLCLTPIRVIRLVLGYRVRIVVAVHFSVLLLGRVVIRGPPWSFRYSCILARLRSCPPLGLERKRHLECVKSLSVQNMTVCIMKRI